MKSPNRLPWNLFIVLFLGVLWGLVGRSVWTGDGRFGWAMFASQVDYRVRYFWIDEAGLAHHFAVPKKLFNARNSIVLYPRIDHRNLYSIGAVRAWVKGFCQYIQPYAPPEARAVKAVLSYQLNRSGPRIREVFETPRP